MRCTVACTLALSMLLLAARGTAWAADTDTEAVLELDASAGVLATEDLTEYADNEVLVCYADGTFEVLTYEDEAALAAGLEDLKEDDENVTLIQPNYAYSTSDFSTNDALAAQQRALSNDGTFWSRRTGSQSMTRPLTHPPHRASGRRYGLLLL